VRLVDNRSGEQFWSDRFDGDLSELFDAQDDLAYRVSTALRFSIYDREVAEMEKVPEAERTDEMLLARIGQTLAGANRHEWAGAGPQLDRILARNPSDSGTHAMKASWHLHEVFYGWRDLAPADRDAVLAEAAEAVRCNERSDFAHMVMSLAHLYADRDPERALRAAERSLELSPFYAIGRYMHGLASIFCGQAEQGLATCAATLQASPRMVINHRIMQGAALGAFLAGRHDEAVDWAKRSDQQARDVAPTLLTLAAAAGEGGRRDDAATAAASVLRLFPDFRLSTMRRWPFRHGSDLVRFVDGLAAAGLPG
jgi:tetratricopeptide (TPR) repeat protein